MKRRSNPPAAGAGARAHTYARGPSDLPPLSSVDDGQEMRRRSKRLPAPMPTRVYARAAALSIPLRPRNHAEYIAAFESISFVRRRRTRRQLVRQFDVFQSWARYDTSVSELARTFRVSRETIRCDLYFEGRRRRDGPDSYEPSVSVLDAVAFFEAWGCRTPEEIREFVRSLPRE